MQRITLIAVGKLQGFYADGVAEYAKRLRGLCRFEQIEIPEAKLNEKASSPALIASALQKEAKQILASLPKGAKLAALCVEGKQIDTLTLSDTLRHSAVDGQGEWVFVIGSSHGLADEIKHIATLKLSLSAMTLPHQLARLVLTEQLYRAFCIQKGTAYHK